MGRTISEKQRGVATKAGKGIAIRHWKDSTTLRISFAYKGVTCRETLALPATKANLQYAERLRAEILNAIARGTFHYGDYFPDSKRARIFGHVNANPLIADLLQEFLEKTRKTQQPITYTTYRKICQTYLIPNFGRIPIKELSPQFIRKWISTLKLTAKTIRNILIPLRAILGDAINDDIIQKNPLDRVVLSKLIDKQHSKSSYAPDPFNIAEIHAILAASHGQMKHLFQFAFFSGLRPSELMALEWKDIDWNKGLVHISRAMVEKHEKCTKTEAGKRTIILLPPAREALIAQKTYTFLEGNKVFHHPHLHKPWQTNAQIRRIYWTNALKKAGVRYRNPYQTRHSYASMLLSAGENMLWVAKQMGHCDTEMIMKTYGKWLPDLNSQVGYQTVKNWETILSHPPTSATVHPV
jgi:integrase